MDKSTKIKSSVKLEKTIKSTAKDSSDEDSDVDLSTKRKASKPSARPKSRAGKMMKNSSDSDEDTKKFKPSKNFTLFLAHVNNN